MTKLLFVGLASTLLAAEPKKTDGALAAQVEQLQREVATLRQVLIFMLQDEQQRGQTLLQLVQSLPARSALPMAAPVAPAPAPAPTPVAAARSAPAPAPAPAAAAAKGRFTISGRVSLANGATPEAAWVFVKSVASRVSGKSLEIRQQNKTFIPGTAVVQVGTRLVFPNFDAVFHDVFSRSPGNVFDLGATQAGDAAKSAVVTSPGIVEVFCNFHSKMTAQVLVVPGPHFAQVQPNGTFTLENVPPGRHTVVAWSPNTKESTTSVELAADVSDVDFSLTPSSQRQHLNKHGQPYGSYGD